MSTSIQYFLEDLRSVGAEFISTLPLYALLIIPAIAIGSLLLYILAKLFRSARLTLGQSLTVGLKVGVVALVLGFLSACVALLPEPAYSIVGEYFSIGAGLVLAIASVGFLERQSALSVGMSALVALPVLALSAGAGFVALFMFTPFS